MAHFDPTALEDFTDADAVLWTERALQRRIDTKFLVPLPRVPALLENLRDSHALLRTGERPLARYETLYFDSADLRFYREHLRGRRPRHKLRLRAHLDRALSFAEIKTKSAGARVHKKRQVRADVPLIPSEADRRFFERAEIVADTLGPSLRTTYRRATLVPTAADERVTVDVELAFRANERSVALSLAVVEVKQPHFAGRSPAMLALRGLGLRPASFSKYCAGIDLLGLSRPRGDFRHRLRRLGALPMDLR
ncbi:MAG: polyphosphate polymerase domain-containing protein [Myxococcota bacterium]